MRVKTLVEAAADLLSEGGENPEYDRAIAELTSRALGYSDSSIPDVARLLRTLKEDS